MPARDGTGPLGAGAMTGRGQGGCNSGQYPVTGGGRQCRAGRGGMQGRGFGSNLFFFALFVTFLCLDACYLAHTV